MSSDWVRASDLVKSLGSLSSAMKLKKALWLAGLCQTRSRRFLSYVLFSTASLPNANTTFDADVKPVTRFVSTVGPTLGGILCTPTAIIVTRTAQKILVNAEKNKPTVEKLYSPGCAGKDTYTPSTAKTYSSTSAAKRVA